MACRSAASTPDCTATPALVRSSSSTGQAPAMCIAVECSRGYLRRPARASGEWTIPDFFLSQSAHQWCAFHLVLADLAIEFVDQLLVILLSGLGTTGKDPRSSLNELLLPG